MVRTLRLVWILAALLGPMSAQAVIVNGTWDFSTDSGGTTYSGTFSLTGFDTSASVIDSTAGFSFSGNFVTPAGLDIGFSYTALPDPNDFLTIGSVPGAGALQSAPAINDFYLVISGLATSPTFSQFGYCPVGAPCVSTTGGSLVARSASVPEPGSLALLGAGVLGLALSRRRRNAS